MYMEGIKYVNMIEIISLVVIEIQRFENGKLVISVNNIFVHHTAFLAADTQLCVLIIINVLNDIAIKSICMDISVTCIFLITCALDIIIYHIERLCG